MITDEKAMRDATRNGPTLDIIGAQRLLCHVIGQAVEDYRMMERKGLIKDGVVVKGEAERFNEGRHMRPTGCKQGPRLGRGLRIESELHELVAFLQRDLDFLCDFARLEVSPDAIRRKLGMVDSVRIARGCELHPLALNPPNK